jgi:hypothetical protein
MAISGWLNDDTEQTELQVEYDMFFAFNMFNNTGLQGYLPLVFTDLDELKPYNFLWNLKN